MEDNTALPTLAEQHPADAQKAFDLEQQVKAVKSQVQGSYLELGRLLKEVRDNDYYKLLGFDTVSEWLSSPDIAISRKWAASAIRVYELYILKLGKKPEEIQNIDYTKLVSLSGLIEKHPEEAEEWIDKASTLRRIDLQSEIKVKKISDRVERIEELQVVQAQDGVIHGNTLEEVKKLMDHSVDAVITSPPVDTPAYVLQELFSELRRVLSPNGSIFIFTDYHNLLHVSNAFLMNDYKLMRDIVLSYTNAVKNTGVNSLLPYHETVLWATRSDSPSYNFTEVERDVWIMKPLEETENPVEKPIETLMQLIKLSTVDGQTILDPFAGSGNIALAAKTLGRSYIAIEEDELWYKIMLEKLQG